MRSRSRWWRKRRRRKARSESLGARPMALDIYVMPLWRFKAGDFLTPIEANLGIRPTIITPDGTVKRPSKAGWIARWKARRQVASVRKCVEAANRVAIRWTDEGDQVYASQSFGMESLRAYAKWLDFRDQMPTFEPPPERNYYKHPVVALNDGRRLTCSHLVQHNCYSGYFLPCEFEQLVYVEPYIRHNWEFARAVGSTPRLLRDLASVQEHLRVSDDCTGPMDDPLREPKLAYLQLVEVAALSCRHGLPIIFWG